MTLPPTQMILDVLSQSVLPAFGGAAAIYCLFGSAGRWATGLGSAAALAFAYVWANYSFPWLFARDELIDPEKWGTGRLFPWTPDDPARAWLWLPKAALVLVVVGLLSRWLGLLAGRCLTQPTATDPTVRNGPYWWGANLLTWAPRVAAVLVVSGWVISERVAAESPRLRFILIAVTLWNWIALDGLARAGAAAQSAACAWLALAAGGTVMLSAHSGQFVEPPTAIGFAFLGLAVAAAATRGDTSGAVPAAAVLLPGFMLVGRESLATGSHQLPAECFWLPAVAPAFLLPFLIPAVARWPRWVAVPLRVLVVLAPLAIAAIQADRYAMPAADAW